MFFPQLFSNTTTSLDIVKEILITELSTPVETICFYVDLYYIES